MSESGLKQRLKLVPWPVHGRYIPSNDNIQLKSMRAYRIRIMFKAAQ